MDMWNIFHKFANSAVVRYWNDICGMDLATKQTNKKPQITELFRDALVGQTNCYKLWKQGQHLS